MKNTDSSLFSDNCGNIKYNFLFEDKQVEIKQIEDHSFLKVNENQKKPENKKLFAIKKGNSFLTNPESINKFRFFL